MTDELGLLRQAHDEQARRLLAERVVAADRVRTLELRAEQLERRAEQLEREVVDAHEELAEARREAADEHEKASRHVEAARAERDVALRQLEEFQQTRTYRLVLLMHRVLSRGPGHSP
jgi:predicted  nucleic acid-binding Zn-ribbon protein